MVWALQMRISLAKSAILAPFLLVLLTASSVVWFTRMPLRSYAGALKPLSSEEERIRDDLAFCVKQLSLNIGERNVNQDDSLDASADYLLRTLGKQGYALNTYQYRAGGKLVKNIEVRIEGVKTPGKNVIVGAHYDSVPGSPGANDNGSGVAGVLELATLLKASRPDQTIRFVFFVNEEPPYFQTSSMGSLVYAKNLRRQNVDVSAMISLETMGYYSEAKGSQHYPAGFGLLYPDVGNFIGFVGSTGSRDLVRDVVQLFRESADFPSEGVAAPAGLAGIGWSDHWSFWQQGYQAIMVTDTALFRYPYYHQPGDTPDKVDFDKMARVVEGLERVILRLAARR
jgi:hypothetical protein